MNSIRNTRGFTIIEILLVVMIMAISAAVVVPMVGNRDDIVIAASARKVVADFQYAQNYAIATRQSIYIRFTTDQYELCTLGGSTLTPITHPVEKSAFVVKFGTDGDSGLQRTSLPVPSIGGTSVLGFDSLGTPFAFDSATVTRSELSSSVSISMTAGDLTQALAVEPYTGEITVP